jgi:hypothetical protein
MRAPLTPAVGRLSDLRVIEARGSFVRNGKELDLRARLNPPPPLLSYPTHTIRDSALPMITAGHSTLGIIHCRAPSANILVIRASAMPLL